jgi:rhodanese-related sulfurtransferase
MAAMFEQRFSEIDVADMPADAHVLDVREPEEWVAGHIDGSQHLPMSQFLQRLHEVPADRDLVVVCAVGQRSARVTAFLNQRGFRASNLGGGLHAWAAAGRPLVSDTGETPYVY